MAARRGRGGRWVLLLALVAAAWVWWQRRAAAGPAPTPTAGDAPYAPFAGTSGPLDDPPAPVAAEPAAATWVAPVDGECPADHPVKASASGIFHMPGGRFYARTTAERCYPDAASATADGYRPSKA